MPPLVIPRRHRLTVSGVHAAFALALMVQLEIVINGFDQQLINESVGWHPILAGLRADKTHDSVLVE